MQMNELVDTVSAAGPIVQCRVVSLGAVHAATDNYGVALADANTGEAVPVCIEGTVRVEVSAAVPLGTKYVVAGADGRVAPGGTANACAGNVRPGQSASAAGGFIEIWLTATV